MKIFDPANSHWNAKTNFVDANNVMLGYDAFQSCCENAGYYFSDSPQPTADGIREGSTELDDLEAWSFDPTFFNDTSPVIVEKGDYNPLDHGGLATFRLIHPDGREHFLHLFNCHNGYYSHGFTFNNDDEVIREGFL